MCAHVLRAALNAAADERGLQGREVREGGTEGELEPVRVEGLEGAVQICHPGGDFAREFVKFPVSGDKGLHVVKNTVPGARLRAQDRAASYVTLVTK